MNDDFLKKKYNIKDEDMDEIELEDDINQVDDIETTLEKNEELMELSGEARAEFFRKKHEKYKAENEAKK